ncbi:MAG: hypothetical protein ACOCWW_00405 [Bacteroidota bacterium]
MFEFIIQYNSENKKAFNSFQLNGDNERHETFHYKDETISVHTLSHKELNYKQKFENSDKLILVNGIILGRHRTGNSYYDASDIAKQLKENTFDYEKFKGEFTLFIYDKKKQSLNIYTAPIGLKPVYYGSIDSHVYISNDLTLLKQIDTDIDPVTLLEKAIFTYPISDNTYLKRFKFLSPGSQYIFNKNDFKKENTFDIESFVFNTINQKFTYSKFVDLFNQNIKQRTTVVDKPLVTLTGGFDGRAVVSSLLKYKIDFYSYSFGAEEGENTSIPERVSRAAGIKYQPVYLNNNYKNQYPFYAAQAITLSDGMSCFERANYNYVFDKLNYQSPVLLSGLIGGEVLGVLFSKTDYFNEEYYNCFLGNKQFNLNSILKNKQLSEFLNISDSEHEELLNRIATRQDILNKLSSQYGTKMLYMYDLITMGFRRFYGTQMHQERYQFENLLPFFDLDILEYLFTTDFKQRYKYSFTKQKHYKFINRKPQASIIQQNSPLLANIPVDRGFKPKHLLNMWHYPYAYYKYYLRNKKRKVEEFFSEDWSQLFYYELLNKNIGFDDLFNDEMICAFMEDYKPEHYNHEFNHLLSAALWASNTKKYINRTE